MAKKPIPDVISKREIYDLGKELLDTQVRVLFYFIYLTGARVTEALRVKARDLKYEKRNSSTVLIVKLFTEKNKKQPIREVPIIIRGIEKHMIEEIQDYTKEMLKEEHLFILSRRNAYKKLVDRLHINVTARQGKKIIEDFDFNVHPHYLRHCRLTHLRQEYGFDIVALMHFAGWSDPKSANPYLHLGYKDLVDAMEKH